MNESTLTAELDQARFKIEALQRKLNEYATSHQQFQLELHNLKAQCAALREALGNAMEWASPTGQRKPLWSEVEAKVAAALALDAGKDFVPADKARVIADCL